MFDEQGFPVSTANNDARACLIAPGEDARFVVVPADWISLHAVGEDRDNVKVIADATLYAREFHKLGEIAVPAKQHGVAQLQQKVKSSLIDGNVTLGIHRAAPSDDDSVDVNVIVVLRSRCEFILPQAELKTRMLDSEGAQEGDVSSMAVDIPAGGVVFLKDCISVHKSMLAGAKLAFELLLFHPVGIVKCEATSTPNDD